MKKIYTDDEGILTSYYFGEEERKDYKQVQEMKEKGKRQIIILEGAFIEVLKYYFVEKGYCILEVTYRLEREEDKTINKVVREKIEKMKENRDYAVELFLILEDIKENTQKMVEKIHIKNKEGNKEIKLQLNGLYEIINGDIEDEKELLEQIQKET